MIPSRIHRLVAGLAVVASTACASVAPRYTSTPDNVNRLRDTGSAPVKVGTFSAAPGAQVDNLSIRGGGYESPYDKSFVRYLEEALRQDLGDARLLDPAAAIEIGGVVAKNELECGMSTGTATLEARFTVTRDGKIRYDKTKSAKHQWDSSFVGAIAIPKAQQNYPTVVQLLLAELYKDADFAAAVKK